MIRLAVLADARQFDVDGFIVADDLVHGAARSVEHRAISYDLAQVRAAFRKSDLLAIGEA